MSIFNLLREKWIPVTFSDGKKSDVAPHEIWGSEDIVRVSSPKPEWDASILQFLIGLYQTALAPNNEREWRKVFKSPHSSEYSKEQILCYESAFNLNGDGPRFYQDRDISSQKDKSLVIFQIDAPGQQTLDLNKDFFVKREPELTFDFKTAAMALMTLQMHAPTGGQGHRASLRGGSVKTSLIIAGNLFQTVWLNVLPLDYFSNKPCNDVDKIFPWMSPCVASTPDKKSKKYTSVVPENRNPLQVFWGCSRRIELQFEGDTVVAFKDKSHGNSYEGWVHPLSSYYLNKDKSKLPSPSNSGEYGYKSLAGNSMNSGTTMPADIVTKFYKDRFRLVKDLNPKIRSLGFHCDNAKIVNWVDFETVVNFPEEIPKEFFSVISSWISLSNDAVYYLKNCITLGLCCTYRDVPNTKDQWSKKPPKADQSALNFQIERNFRHKTESGFYRLKSELEKDLSNPEIYVLTTKKWCDYLAKELEAMFDSYVREDSSSILKIESRLRAKQLLRNSWLKTTKNLFK